MKDTRKKIVSDIESEKPKNSVIGIFEGECADSNITNENGLDITRPVWENIFSSESYQQAIELSVNENWVDIPGYENLYQCSDLGRIRSKDRVRKQLNRYGKEILHTYKGKLLSIDYSTSRFGCINLYDVDKKTTISIYSVVCEIFGQEYADLFFLGHEFKDRLDGEVWKTISEYPCYKISSMGRVMKDMKKYKIILRPWVVSGYYTVNLNKDGSFESVAVHRLVASYFLEKDENRDFVNHKDGNKLNNAAYNLEWVTPSENMIHAYRNGLCKVDRQRLRKSGLLGAKKVSIRVRVPEIDTTFESILQCSKKLRLSYDKIYSCIKSGSSLNGYSFIKECD